MSILLKRMRRVAPSWSRMALCSSSKKFFLRLSVSSPIVRLFRRSCCSVCSSSYSFRSNMLNLLKKVFRVMSPPLSSLKK